MRYSFLSKLLPLFLLLSICLSGFSFSQKAPNYPVLSMPDSKEKVDSILNIVENNRYDVNRQILYNEAFRLVEKFNYKSAEPLLYNSYGVFKRDMSQYDDAIHYHKIALDLAKSHNNVKEEIKAYNNLGVAYRRVDDYNMALDYLTKAWMLAEKMGDNYSVTIALNSIGNIHVVREDYRAAIYYFKLCMPIAARENNKRGLAINLQNMGECYERMGMMDSAKIYYKRALGFNIIRNDDKGIAICYNSLGNILIREGQIDRGLNLLKKALDINIKLGDQLFIANSYSNLGKAYFLKKDYQMAQQMFDTSLNIANTIRSVVEAKNAYEGLTKTAAAREDWKAAFEYGSLFKELSDSILLKNNQSLRNKEFAYHQEKVEMAQKVDRNKNIIMVGSLILFLLLLITGVLYYLRLRLLERNRSLQRELEIRAQIASDLHDDMGSSLSSIHIFSELLRKSGAGSHDLLSKIEANAKDTLEALDDIIWLVKPSNDKFSNLSTHISEFAIPLFESKNINFEIEFPENIADIPIPMETRRNIFLIIKESVNNLVKYSECTEASIKAWIDNNILRFVVKDNGKGFNPNQETNRNGIKNLRARAKQINADIDINSTPGRGTEIILTINAKDFISVNAAS